jgi:hypothetical protein
LAHLDLRSGVPAVKFFLKDPVIMGLSLFSGLAIVFDVFLINHFMH